MADFTVELRNVIDAVGFHGLGLDDYPIFDETYRDLLNKKIVNHYWYNEIGHETIDMFVRQLRTKMHEIMPYYNDMYRTKLIEVDPLSTMDMRTRSDTGMIGETTNKSNAHTDTGTTGSTKDEARASSTSTTTTDSKSRAVASETPQVMLNNNGDYATSAQDSIGSTGAKGTGTANDSRTGSVKSDTVFDSSTDDIGRTRTDALTEARTHGYSGHVADLIMRWRDSLINIDMMVIDELKPLFMQLWNSGDEYGNYYDFSY